MTGSERDEWADDMFAEMARMFEQMGMSIDIKSLEAMMNQIREQFEQMGIDPTKLSHSQIKVDTNTEPEEFRRIMESMLNGPDGISELLNNMGVNIQVNGPSEAEAEAEETEESDVSDLPEEDIYVHDGRMSVTIDISRFLDIRPEHLGCQDDRGRSPVTRRPVLGRGSGYQEPSGRVLDLSGLQHRHAVVGHGGRAAFLHQHLVEPTWTQGGADGPSEGHSRFDVVNQS